MQRRWSVVRLALLVALALVLPPPPAGSAETCQIAAPPPSFDPHLKWSWTGSTVEPDYRQVIATPIVVNLNDDDGDGKVTTKDIPDVVFLTTNRLDGGLCSGDTARLRAVSGKDGSTVFDVTDRLVHACVAPAVGDLDGDGIPEIVVATGSGFAIYGHDGAFKALTDPVGDVSTVGAPSIADIDHDGHPEIIVGGTVLDHDGHVRFSHPDFGNSGLGAISVAVDLDLSGDLEIVTGFRAFKSDGSPFYTTPGLGNVGGYPAVGNFDDDPNPEVVVVHDGQVTLLEHDGTVKWGPVALPGGGRGGPPTVADFDGDGKPEIGVAGASRYVVFETDGTVKWQSPTQDGSSNITGSSVFDFEQDGSAEVLYNDELKFRIYRGSDGMVLFDTPNTSCTATENPVVVDVDNDGHADIVVAFNEICGFGNAGSGIKVFSDLNNTWVRTRRIWNEHAYHVTNVNEDGSIPKNEAANWLTAGLNNFRLNAFVPGEGNALDAPDLVVTLSDDQRACPQGNVVTAHVKNAGAAGVAAG